MVRIRASCVFKFLALQGCRAFRNLSLSWPGNVDTAVGLQRKASYIGPGNVGTPAAGNGTDEEIWQVVVPEVRHSCSSAACNAICCNKKQSTGG
jgi:hypothetical protein